MYIEKSPQLRDDWRVPVSTLAHDLLQPLRAIVVNVQRIQRSGELQSADTKAKLDAVLAAAHDQEEIIAGIMEHDSATPEHWAGDDVGPLALSVQAACLKLDAYRKGHNGTIEIMKPLPEAEVPSVISKVLEKVVHNSLKFRASETPPVVAIEAWEEPAGNITLRVTDNGLGVAAKYRTLVFQPFSRLNPKSSYPGAGLGLTICTRLMECIGGTITFEDPAGATGASVLIRFPMKVC